MDILWRRLTTNGTTIAKVASAELKNELSLPEMRSLLHRLGHNVRAMDALAVVHIAGSKGKGSTAAFVERILARHGLATALYTSPHLVHPRERIRFNGRQMDELAFCEAVNDVYDRLGVDKLPCGERPGFFRFMTLLAFDRMLHTRPPLDVAIIEVGMGGRFDATNVVAAPAVTAIAALEEEHIRLLGPTIAHIAQHKAGIAKAGVPLVVVPDDRRHVMEAIRDVASTVGAPVHIVGTLEEELAATEPSALGGAPPCELGIDGRHQRTNAALAVAICRQWFRVRGGSCLSPRRTREALAGTRWPGRHQVHVQEMPPTGLHGGVSVAWHLDGAHTIASATLATQWFIQRMLGRDRSGGHPEDGAESCCCRRRRRILLFHCAPDKAYAEMLGIISSLSAAAGLSFGRALFVKPQSIATPPQPREPP